MRPSFWRSSWSFENLKLGVHSDLLSLAARAHRNHAIVGVLRVRLRRSSGARPHVRRRRGCARSAYVASVKRPIHRCVLDINLRVVLYLKLSPRNQKLCFRSILAPLKHFLTHCSVRKQYVHTWARIHLGTEAITSVCGNAAKLRFIHCDDPAGPMLSIENVLLNGTINGPLFAAMGDVWVVQRNNRLSSTLPAALATWSIPRKFFSTASNQLVDTLPAGGASTAAAASLSCFASTTIS